MKMSIADHFFLGGPLNLRGFDIRGCGPRYDGNSIGGEIYWAGALHIYTPLPFRPGRNSFGDLFRLHGFVNAGNLSNITFTSGDSIITLIFYNWSIHLVNNVYLYAFIIFPGNLYNENMKIFSKNVRCAIGGGLAMRLGNVARIELNLVAPLLYMRSDMLQQFQFGIGVQYLWTFFLCSDSLCLTHIALIINLNVNDEDGCKCKTERKLVFITYLTYNKFGVNISHLQYNQVHLIVFANPWDHNETIIWISIIHTFINQIKSLINEIIFTKECVRKLSVLVGNINP